MNARPSALIAGLAGVALLFAACAAPPPRTAAPELRARVALPTELVGSAASAGGNTSGGGWPEAQWWHGYGDPALDALEQQALKSAPGMAAAAARIELAGQQLALARAAGSVQVEADASAERQRLSDHGLFPPQFLGFHWYDQFDVGARLRYSFDWWGKQRAAITSALDGARASEADASAAALALSVAVADTYFAWQADQQRVALAARRAESSEHARRIAAARRQAGIDGPESLQRAELASASARDQLAVQKGSGELRRLQLAALVGADPGALPPLAAQELPVPRAGLPASASLDLVARRADIAASRWRVEAALQNVHAARAKFLPDLSLKALAGLSSIELGHLLDINSRAPSAGLALHLPLFDGRALAAGHSARQAELRAAVASYDQTLLDAARQVAQQLSVREQLGERSVARASALAAAVENLRLARDRVQRGTADRRVELEAEQAELEQQAAVLELRAAALAADVALIQALGGGYEIPGNQT